MAPMLTPFPLFLGHSGWSGWFCYIQSSSQKCLPTFNFHSVPALASPKLFPIIVYGIIYFISFCEGSASSLQVLPSCLWTVHTHQYSADQWAPTERRFASELSTISIWDSILWLELSITDWKLSGMIWFSLGVFDFCSHAQKATKRLPFPQILSP